MNWFGYGALSPLAGWATAEVSLNPTDRRALGARLPRCMLGAYFAAQAFQREEDRDEWLPHAGRDPRSARRPSRSARACLVVAFVGATVGLALVGWIPRICLLADRRMARSRIGSSHRWMARARRRRRELGARL